MDVSDYQEATLEGAEAKMDEPSDDPVVMDWRRDAGWNTLESMLGISGGGNGPVGLSEALRQHAVLACVDVITRDVSKVPCYLYKRLPDGGKQRVMPGQHWLADMLALDPNEEHSWAEFWQVVVIHLVLANNAFIVKKTARDGTVLELVPMTPGRVTITFDPETGEKFYFVGRGSMLDQALLRDVGFYLGRDDVIHLRKRIVDGLYGYSTLAAGGPTIRLSKAIQEYQDRLYDNDGQGRISVQPDKDTKSLSDPAFQRMKQEVRAASRNMFRNGDAMLLEPGYTAKVLSMTAADMKISEMADAQVTSVASLFGVPPHKIGHVKDEKYSNMEVFERLYAHDVVIPTAKVLEDGLGRSVLTKKERLTYFLEFDRRMMEIIDFKIRSEAMKIGLQHGAVDADEFREIFSMNPLKGKAGKIRFFQSTMTVVDENNEVIVPAGAQKPTDQQQADDTPPADAGKGIRVVK